MTSTIEWDEDWFSLEERKKADEVDDVDETDRADRADKANEALDVVDVVEVADLAESVESIKEWIEKDVRIQEKEREREREKSVNEEKRMDWLEILVHQQAEAIRVLKEDTRLLKEEVRVLKEDTRLLKEEVVLVKGEVHSTSRTSMTQLLEELKRVKERELNYALRRHQPVPFFDSRNLIRMVGSVGLAGSVSGIGSVGGVSPLFRSQIARSHVPVTQL